MDAATVYREQEGLHGIDPSCVSLSLVQVRSLEVEGHGAPVPFASDLRDKNLNFFCLAGERYRVHERKIHFLERFLLPSANLSLSL